MNCEWHETWGTPTPRGTGQPVPIPGIWNVTAAPTGTHHEEVEALNMFCVFPKDYFFFPPASVVSWRMNYSRAAAPRVASSPPGVLVAHLGKISAPGDPTENTWEKKALKAISTREIKHYFQSQNALEERGKAKAAAPNSENKENKQKWDLFLLLFSS